MHIARSVIPLAVVAGLLWTASPVHSIDRAPAAVRKQAPKPPPPANNPQAKERIAKKESRMKQRDKEMDKRMKLR